MNNSYFQSYVNSLSPILVPILSVGFGITSATVATLLYFTVRNIRQRERLHQQEEDVPRRRGVAKRTVKKRLVSSLRIDRPVSAGLTMPSKQRVVSSDAASPKHGTAQESSDEEDESD